MKNARTPVVVIGLLAAGWWLGSMFKGFGPGGPGTSTKTGTGDGVAVESRDPNAQRTAIEQQKEDSAAVSRAVPDVTGEAAKRPAPGEAGGSSELVTIIVDGAGYAVARGDGAPEPATLDAAVALAKGTTGDDQGVHVRIQRKKNAQAGARADLLIRLQDAGLKRESIQEMSGFID